MKKNKYSKWTLSFGALGGIIGIILAQIGDLDFGVVLGALTGAILIVIINIVYVRKKSDETPEFDERTIRNIQTFYFYAAIIFFILLFITLGGLLAIGVTSIPVLVLFVVSFGYFVISGIIALIISRN